MSFLNNIGKLITGAAPSVQTATSSRSVARERLSVILASQRGSDLLEGVDMEALQKDVMDVVQVRMSSC
jgi:septum formation topological specificity factor MinE